jgi:hypothetical protein
VQCPRADEASVSEYELRAAAGEVLLVEVDEIANHPLFALAHRRHIDGDGAGTEAELGAAPRERDHLGAVDDVLAWKASDVRARAADVLSLDDRHAVAIPRVGPREKLRAFAASEDHEIVVFHGHENASVRRGAPTGKSGCGGRAWSTDPLVLSPPRFMTRATRMETAVFAPSSTLSGKKVSGVTKNWSA